MNRKSKRRIAVLGGTIVVVALLALFVAAPALAASCFTDTEFHWAETYICWLFDEGMSVGYPDGTFRPDSNITRGRPPVASAST